ncbi:MAG TPA: hypothetical protein VM658_03370 [bacterium]|nr:hypothetical protein [bacterium]
MKMRENCPNYLAPLNKTKFKLMDLCRSLHAEENAILNLARHGMAVDFSTCTLITTTEPCRLCSNKISMVGINRVIYSEPYPDPVSVSILRSGNATLDFFEGVTFKGYFRIFGGNLDEEMSKMSANDTGF